MRLISVNLVGQYKGLSDRLFSFERAEGDVIALIGLNGSGKSQLLELIAESFSYLERYNRRDFVNRSSLPFDVTLKFSVNLDPDIPDEDIFTIAILRSRDVICKKIDPEHGELDWTDELPLPLHIVGYASGLNENLQRAFMKNAVQYFEIMKVRMRRRKELEGVTGVGPLADINRKYLNKYSHLFFERTPEASYADYFFPEHEILEADTTPSQLSYIDYDSFPFLVVAISILSRDERDRLLSQIQFRHPLKIVMHYDLKNWIFEEDTIRDIKLLVRVAGEHGFFPMGLRASDQDFEAYGLEYLKGKIVLDLMDENVISELRETNYDDPLQLFNRLYKIHLLGVKNWPTSGRRNLLWDDFLGTVKKPLKSKMPLIVDEILLADTRGSAVNIDDLSDGEAQLLQILGVISLYRNKQTLFLFDEPETHLNPAWRTFFHNHLEDALSSRTTTNERSQVFLSTHSPFMISSLKKENVFFFERNDNDGQVSMVPAHSQTYGASFEVLIKNYYGLKSVISQSAVEDVKAHLSAINTPEDRRQALSWIEENLGESMEKAYLLRKLQN